METKCCKTCKILKPISEFKIASIQWVIKATGEKKSNVWTNNTCKKCQAAATAARRLLPGYNDNERLRAREWKTRDPAAYLLQAAKKRAKIKGIPFTITKQDIVVPLVCPLLNIPLQCSDKYSPNSPSLDRIVNHLGYVKGNVAVISRLANAMKNNCTKNQLKVFAKNIIPYVTRQRRRSKKTIK